jgi:hypothetical protein
MKILKYPILMKIFKHQIFMKIRRVEAEFFHADRWTDRHDEANQFLTQYYLTMLVLFR